MGAICISEVQPSGLSRSVWEVAQQKEQPHLQNSAQESCSVPGARAARSNSGTGLPSLLAPSQRKDQGPVSSIFNTTCLLLLDASRYP